MSERERFERILMALLNIYPPLVAIQKALDWERGTSLVKLNPIDDPNLETRFLDGGG